MIGKPREKSQVGHEAAQPHSVQNHYFGKSEYLTNNNSAIPVISAMLQIIIGLTLVGTSLIGLLQPLWFSALLSLAGSVSCITGVYLIYHTLSSQDTFDSLINKAIRRVVKEQN